MLSYKAFFHFPGYPECPTKDGENRCLFGVSRGWLRIGMMRIASFAALPLPLSACTIPTAVAVYSGVEAVTYLGSGKVIPSHVLSAGAEQDCSLLFGITRGQFCKPKEKSLHHTAKDAGFIMPKDLPLKAERVASTGVLESRFFDFDYEVPPKWRNIRPLPPARSRCVLEN